jgi:xanthine dehydrogenase molybdenum-binding subunit
MSSGSATRYRVIGTRPVRPDGVDKVTGRAVYGADVVLPRLAHGKVLRSPHAHARIRRIDTARAAAHPGVLAVITSADLPATSGSARLGELGDVNLAHLSGNVLAHDRVLYEGHPVAALAAINAHVAEEALALIEVDYEPLPPVMDVDAAMAPGAPLLHDDTYTDVAGEKAAEPSNVAAHLIFEEGDVEAGFAAAAHVVEREFTTATVHQGYIEPHSATAEWRADGQLTVWCCTQGSFTVRTQLGHLLQHPVSLIKVVPTEIGGGFGGKIGVYTEPLAAVLARKSGRPVKVTMDRAEVLRATGPTPASKMKIKVGVDASGKITAAQAWLAFEAGAYPGSPIGAGCMTVFAPYRLQNVRIDGLDVLVNKPKSAAYRAPGATQSEFAAETVMDELARLVGLDPIAFRRLNGAREGDWRAGGPPYNRIGNLECLAAAEASEHWRTPLDRRAPAGRARGRGVASGYWFNIGLTSSASGRLNSDGTVTLLEGSTDIGGTRASIAMQFAEEFGVPYEAVHPAVVDTESVGYTEVTGGSRVTYATGYAAYELAREMKRRIVAEVAEMWDVRPEEISIQGDTYRCNGKAMNLAEIAREVDERGKQITASVTVSPTGSGGAFATHIVDVEVDTETGKVDILRYTAVQDAGTAIHPSYVEGQMQGGVVQGIGWALNEEYWYDAQGHLRNASLLDYRMPTALDVPLIDTIIVEVPNPGHPYGVRGVGEVPIVPPPAAIANALFDATGVRLRHLPMNPARVCAALQAQAGD